jgi:hypothetical protein
MSGTSKRANNCGVLFRAGVFVASRANVVSQERPTVGVKFPTTSPSTRRYIWLKLLKKAIKLS